MIPEYSTEVCTVRYLEDVPCIEMKWQGFASSKDFRAGNENVLASIKEKGANKLIGDLSEMRIISLDDQEWILENWFPRASQAGLEAVALVASSDFFNRLTIEKVLNRMDEDMFNVRLFENRLSAKVWLRGI